MLTAATMWGMMAPLGKDAMAHGIGGLGMVALRVSGAALLFWLASFISMAWRKCSTKNPDKQTGEAEQPDHVSLSDHKELLWLFGAGISCFIELKSIFYVGQA